MKNTLGNPHFVGADSSGDRLRLAHDLSVSPLITASIKEQLRLLAANCITGSELMILLPKDGQERVRNLVHRGAPRPVCKYPSFKLNRTVECESLLEMDLATLLDATPVVTAFAEQAMTLRYLDDGIWRHHVPDYVVLSNGQLYLVEVKFVKDVDVGVQARTAHLKALLAPFGLPYLVWTEEDIRQGAWLENAKQLLRRGRHGIDDLELLNFYELLRSRGPCTLGQWGWNESGSQAAVGVARLALDGWAGLDLSRRLNAQAKVWSINGNSQEEVGQWPLARFA